MNRFFSTFLLVLLGCTNSKQPVSQASKSSPATAQPTTIQPQAIEVNSVEPRAASPDDWFRVVTEESGINFAYRNGREGGRFTLLETVGGGVAMLDYDVDGDLDLLFCGGGSISSEPSNEIRGFPAALYRNDGQWRFKDVTTDAGLSNAADYTHGVVVADYDRNGFPDLFITAYGQCRLLKNEKGVFRDVSQSAGVAVVGWTTAAAWADIDRDGYPDLYVAEYVEWSIDRQRECMDAGRKVRDVCPPQDHPGAADHLFRNRGDGTFEEVTQAAGLQMKDRGLGVLAGDFNHDSWPDFYVANDGDENRLYLGGPTLPLKEAGLWAGVATSESGLAEGGMGVDAGDYNGDGRIDIFVTNFELENNSLYRGDRDGLFTHATFTAGLAGDCFPYVGFGTGFADFDLDSWPDLYICNGNVYYHLGQRPYKQPAFLYRNEEGKRFGNVSNRGGPYFSVPHAGRGAAIGDLDNDGGLDLVVVHQNDRVAILRNQLRPPLWIRVQLEGTQCDREAVGARVTIPFRGRRLVQWVRSGAGYLSQSDQRMLFPLESDAPVEVTVQWPNGAIEKFSQCAPQQTNKLVEGHGQKSAPNKAD